MNDNFKKNLDLGEQNIDEGLEEYRKDILEVSLFMFDKIKHFGSQDRESILEIMKVLSKYCL